MTLHELPLERRTLHGCFSPELEPVLEVEPGDRVALAAPDAGWGLVPPRLDGTRRPKVVERRPELDRGHALVGPVAIRGAGPGSTVAVTLEELRVGPYGWSGAGGWQTPLNDRLGVSDGAEHDLVWELDGERRTARDQHGRTVALRPFLGTVGLAPAEPGIHSTFPPRRTGGNLDCKELVAGTTLFLPVAVDGGLLSLGDGHALQGDGEVSSLAIETPVERALVRIELRDDLELEWPQARTADGWLAFGFDEDLDEAAAVALDNMLALMARELGLARRDALALASLVVDLRVTQLVNGVRGVHAFLPDGAIT